MCADYGQVLVAPNQLFKSNACTIPRTYHGPPPTLEIFLNFLQVLNSQSIWWVVVGKS